MDIGTLPWTDEKFRYFLCMVDVFTRYIELVPLQEQTAASLIREFERGWIFRGHGVPRGLLSDQARNIDGVEVRRMCDRLGIEKRHSSPYHPQADGLVERSIGLVKQVARCLTLDRQLPKESWPDILPEVAFYCNNTQNASTKLSAQLLMTGRQPLSPIDAILSRRKWTEELSHSQQVERLQQLSSELKCLAAENDRISRMDRNFSRNQGTRLHPFAKDDLVLETNERCKDSLDPKYKGPYTVLDVRGANVKIKKKGKLKWIHVSRCKLFKEGAQLSNNSSVVVQAAVAEGPEGNDSGREEQVDASCEPIGQEPSTDTTEIESSTEAELEPDGQEVLLPTQRRYPLRDRRAKKYDDYVLETHQDTGPFV
ncbi:Retrovirus-related Pol polyprotein from transposon 17.6 [Oopsacas minuta]|uniref:Retrovirus-related Pol polyprotein from transposon 17.6 n=1 Tax=Oopsacas minuta TaxID=111878 RepID=A0AAV7JNF6_9METZ|nr:Retrovirus-related Pol polyprotein from transposon 17.6 [Oopsacas minuta]